MHSLLIRIICVKKLQISCCQSGTLFQSGPINLLQPCQFSNCVCCIFLCVIWPLTRFLSVFLSVFVYYVCFVSFLLQLHSDSWLLKCCVKASTLDNKFVTFPTADHRTVPGVWLQTTDCIWKSNKNAPDLFSSLPMTLFEDTATRVSERWKNRCFCVTFLNDPQSLWKRRR